LFAKEPYVDWIITVGGNRRLWHMEKIGGWCLWPLVYRYRTFEINAEKHRLHAWSVQ